MFLQEANVLSVTKQQFRFKLQANYGIFTSLLLTQLFALVWSFMGTGSMGTGTQEVSINVRIYNGNMMIIFTMLWAFVSGVTITSKTAKDGDFSFVTNRLTSNLSNIAFLLTGSVIAGFTAMLGSSLLKVIIYYFFGNEQIMAHSYYVPPSQLAIGILTTVLYVSLLASLGFFVGVLVLLNKIYVVLLSLVFIGLAFLEARLQGNGLLGQLVKYFIAETSFLMLFLKIMLAMIILFFAAVSLSNRLEVRK